MDYLTQTAQQAILSGLFAGAGMILITLDLCSRFVYFLLSTFTKKKIVQNRKSSIVPFAGTCFIVMLSILANHPVIYAIAIIIVATLITELAFLEKLMALLWNRKDYWKYQETIAISKLIPQSSASPSEKKEVDEIAKAMESSQQNVNVNTNPNSQWLLLYHFERVYRLIFGTQLGLLQYLRILGDKGLTKYEIGEIYKNNPISTIYSLDDYIGFLTANQLVNFNSINNSYHISQLGVSFLEYLEKNQISPVRPN